MEPTNDQRGVAVLIKIKVRFSNYNCAARLKAAATLTTGPAAWLRDKQDPTIVNQAPKAMRRHIQSRDIERVFASYHCPGTLRPKDLVDLAFDLRKI